MLITPIDALFILSGLSVVIAAVRRRWTPPPADSAPPATVEEILLTLLALIPAAIGPNVLVVGLTPGMPPVSDLARWALLPSVIVFVLVWIVAWAAGHDRLTNRLWTGLWAGLASTAALDVFRLTSFHLGLLPGNLPRMFGVLLLNSMAQGPTPLSDFVGYLYHYWISACFGLTCALLIGKARWWCGVVWALIIEVGMMTTPPMVIAMGAGYFGLNLGHGLLNGVFLGSLVPHIAYGIALGMLLERYLRHRGTLAEILWDALRQRNRGRRPTMGETHP
jgi:hypothetical protein